MCQEIKKVGEQRLRSGRQHIDIIPITLQCADLSKESLMRLGIKSCFCCDNFWTDHALKLQLVRQDDASYQKYGCRGHVPIQVNVKYSYWHQHNENHTNLALDQPSQHENTNFIIQDVPVKVKRNVAKWRAKK